MKEDKPWWAQQSLPAEPKTVSSAAGGTSIQRGVISVVSSFAVIVTAMVSVLVLGPNPELPRNDIFGSVSYPASAESLIAQCGDTYTYKPDQKYYGALPDDFFDDPAGGPDSINRSIPSHPMRVPAYGYFVNDEKIKFKKNFYTVEELTPLKVRGGEIPAIQRIEYLKLMWEGWKIIWYAPSIDETTKEAVKAFVDENEKVMALPWQDPTAMPMNRNFSFSAWNVTRSCGLWDSDVATSFMAFADDYNKDRDQTSVPEVKLESNGELPRMDIRK